METLSSLLLGYVVGSLPIGYLLAQWQKGVDLRHTGSGNVGAANVYRTAGLGLALLVVLVDIAKGASSVLIASRLSAGIAEPVAAGLAAVIGHVYPVWLRFRGGKGVATACGVFMLLAPAATLAAAATFVTTVAITRYVSLGSVVATAALPAMAWTLGATVPVVVGAVIAASLIIGRHRSNLARLHEGTERRLGQRA
jgi:glycerol-3-phosphate acyltransferase PlsY